MILEDGSQKLLIDCGSDARYALHELGLTYRDILHVYISHLHADHIGGLEWLALGTKFDPNCTKPHLYAQDTLMNDLWNHSLSGGLSSLKTETPTLEAFFEVHPILNQSFSWNGHQFTIFPAPHVDSETLERPNCSWSYGLYFVDEGKRVLITTDVRFVPDYMMEYYEKADVIFQDCETSPSKSGVHAHYTELVTLDPKIKNKMWLYHYQPGELPDAKRDGFKGFAVKGQCFDFKTMKI